MSRVDAGNEAAAQPLPKGRRIGLSGRLALLVITFVMVANALILLPLIGTFRTSWLQDRIASAQVTALLAQASPGGTLADTINRRVLDTLGADRIAIKTVDDYRIIASRRVVPDVGSEDDLRTGDWIDDISDAVDTLLHGSTRTLRLIGPAPAGGDHVEMILPEQNLRMALMRYARNVLLRSLFISVGLAVLVFAALNRLIIQPVKRLSDSFDAFGTDRRHIHLPSGRNDEIGAAEQKLHNMQGALEQQFRQQQRLADLGLAVAKINHDLRNMLSSAQLLSDRIATSDDPTVQRLAPKLVGAIDHAIAFCQNLLHFGQANEPAPSIRNVSVEAVLTELSDIMALAENEALEFIVDVPPNKVVRADPNQLLRALMNVVRNAIEAMSASGTLAPGSRLSITARPRGALVDITIADNGPGIPHALRERLFKPFSATAKSGSAGLGLAITAELLRAQGGEITLLDSAEGTSFRLTLPR